jgi:hypothetical protein
MLKLDRLGWTAGIAFRSYGLRIGVRVNDAAALPRIMDCLPPGSRRIRRRHVDMLFSLWIGAASGRKNVRNYHLLYQGAERLGRTENLDDLYTLLEHEIQLFVAEHAKDRVLVHAGVVGWRGQAIVIPGRSFSGKSTLVEALLRAGADYYSDEYAVLDSRGRVHPYARRLALRERDGRPPQKASAEELGSRTGARPLPVGLVALPRYFPGKHWQPRELSQGQAVLEIMNNTMCAQKKPEIALATLRRVVAGATVLKGPRGDADETARTLLEQLGRPTGLATRFAQSLFQGVRTSCCRWLSIKV